MTRVVTSLHGPLTVLPLHPQAPVLESLAWLTDVTDVFDGTAEARIALRSAPRQGFTYSFPANVSRSATQALNTVWGGLRDRWAIPVWTEAQPVGRFSASVSELELAADYRDYRPESLALVWENPDLWELVEVDEVAAGGLLLAAPLAQAYRNAWVLPARVGRIEGTPTKNTNGATAVHSVRFEVQDNLTLVPEAPAQYLGEDLDTEEGLLTGAAVSDNLIQRVDAADFDTGAVSWRTPWFNPKTSRPFRRVLEGAEEVWDFREWLHRRAGRYRPFWQPSFENDLRILSQGNLGDSIEIAEDSYMLSERRAHLIVQSDDGEWHPRAITMVAVGDPGRVVLTLDSALNVDASRVLRTSYLGLKRLDADRISLNWSGGGVCVSSVRTLELNP